MVKFEIGDKVKVNTPKYWQEDSSYRFANAVGTVSVWVDWPEIMNEFSEYIYVKIDKVEEETKIYENQYFFFMDENLSKL